jgi:TetR/AcrR family transcriptional regulator
MPLSFKERTRQYREDEILQHALKLIRANPTNDLKLDDLADAVGISKPTLYQHFASKDDLVAHIMLMAFDRFEQHMHVLPVMPPLEQLQSALRWLLHERYTSGCSLSGAGGDVFARIAHSHPGVIKRRHIIGAMLDTIIETARGSGQIDPFVPPEYVRGLLFSLMSLPKIAGVTPLEGEALDNALEIVVDLFTRAVAP